MMNLLDLQRRVRCVEAGTAGMSLQAWTVFRIAFSHSATHGTDGREALYRGSMNDLAEAAAISRRTVKRALQTLQDEGLVLRIETDLSGTRVVIDRRAVELLLCLRAPLLMPKAVLQAALAAQKRANRRRVPTGPRT